MSRYANRKKKAEAIRSGIDPDQIERVKPPMSRYWKRRKLAEQIRKGIVPSSDKEFVLPTGMKIAAIIFGIFAIWLYTEILRALLEGFSRDWAGLTNRLHQQDMVGWVALMVGFVGYGFYELRRKRRVAYSIVEFSAALMVTAEACLRTTEPATLAAALMTSIYFVVRAFDNLEKGLQELDAPPPATGK